MVIIDHVHIAYKLEIRNYSLLLLLIYYGLMDFLNLVYNLQLIIWMGIINGIGLNKLIKNVKISKL